MDQSSAQEKRIKRELIADLQAAAKAEEDSKEKGPQPKFLFICGSVASGIGKGITNSSVGLLLKEYGFEVSFMKIDPYLNIDAGTMNPVEHGEVYVTADGGEVDLDLGNYERFMNINLTKQHSMTTGKLYQRVLQQNIGNIKGKKGKMIPHVIDEIKDWIREVAKIQVNPNATKKPEIFLVEVGGTVGDLESNQYYEAIRQMVMEDGKENILVIQLAYIMEIGGEQKTKPVQNGIKDLRYTGIQPDFLICRSERPMQDSARKKLAIQSSLNPDQVLSVPNLNHIYEVPWVLGSQNLVEKIIQKFQLPKIEEPNLLIYKLFPKRIQRVQKNVKTYRIGIFAKYLGNRDAYMSLEKAIQEAAYEVEIKIEIVFFDLIKKSGSKDAILEDIHTCQGIIVPGGFGIRAWEDKIFVATQARKLKIPFIGICYGFQAAVVAHARHFSHKPNPNADTQEIAYTIALEYDSPPTKDHYVVFMPEIDKAKLGGTMRLGTKVTEIYEDDSLAFKIYGKSEIYERHRHRYEVNPKALRELQTQSNLKFTGTDETGYRQHILEVSDKEHPFYVGVQYHPEFTSKNFAPNPLFVYFLYKVAGLTPLGETCLQLKSSRNNKDFLDRLVTEFSDELITELEVEKCEFLQRQLNKYAPQVINIINQKTSDREIQEQKQQDKQDQSQQQHEQSLIKEKNDGGDQECK